MPIDIKREEFAVMPKAQQDLVVFDNLVAIKTSVKNFGSVQAKQQVKIDNNRRYGGWIAFAFACALGLRKWLPI